MRTPIIAGNWKMNKTIAAAVELARAVADGVVAYDGVERVVCPPYVALPAVAEALRGTPVGVGAQNVSWAAEGAYTGQVAVNMLDGLAGYVILGHSEVRQYLHETDADVNRKLHAVLNAGLTPIVAVGESLTQFNAGETRDVVAAQVRAAFEGVTPADAPRVVIAYEPIWAIGKDAPRAATPAEAHTAISDGIRPTLRDLYGDDVNDQVRVQYGGSATPDNLAGFLADPDIDGALVGGASLKPDQFIALVRIAAEAKRV